MAYKLISAGDKFDFTKGSVVFLGGNCRGNKWREECMRHYNDKGITLISPYRESFPNPETNAKAHAEVVAWERDAIQKADIAIFWLGSGLSNQASRVEIGYALGAGKTVLVGAEEDFLGVEHLSAFGGLVFANSLPSLLTRLDSEIKTINK